MQYSLCAEALRIVCPSRSRKARVIGILETLFSLTPVNGRDPGGMELLVCDRPAGEVCGELVFDAPGLSAIRTERGYHLRSGGSFLALDPRSGKAAGSLSEAFLEAPLEDQRGLFLFAFLLLLAARGLYGMHAGGALWNGCGFLLAGRSGSGKTTLICALARSGWEYLSDDSVMLKRGASGLESLAFGRPFHCAPAMFRHFPELAGGGQKPVSGKRLVDVGRVYPGRFRGALRPRIVLFPEITATPFSRVAPLSCTETLVRLLGEGAGVLHDCDSMAGQMVMLGDLARSAIRRAWRRCCRNLRRAKAKEITPMGCIPRPDPDVVVTAMPDGDMILLHLVTRQYLSLNETGAFLWKLMDKFHQPRGHEPGALQPVRGHA